MIVRRLAALLLLILVAWNLALALPTGELRDYGSFVASGRAASQGQNPYGIHPLTFHVVLPGFDVWNPNLNPPVSVPVFQLFDRVDPLLGFRIWWSVSLICYVIALLLLVRYYGAGASLLLPLWALALAGFWDTLALGQIYLPLVLAAVASWLLLDRGRPLTAGVLMGIVVAVKPNFAVWPALLVLSGHYRAPLAAGATAIALMVVPLVMHGAGIYRQWIDLILSDRNRAAFLTNTSLPGLAERLGVGAISPVLGIALLAGLAVWTFVRRPAPLRASALGILGGIAASPLAWIHYTLFLVPMFFTTRMSKPLLAAAALLVVPVPIVLRFLDAPLWHQATAGSIYNWAVLLCLAHMALTSKPERSHGRTRMDTEEAVGHRRPRMDTEERVKPRTHTDGHGRVCQPRTHTDGHGRGCRSRTHTDGHGALRGLRRTAMPDPIGIKSRLR